MNAVPSQLQQQAEQSGERASRLRQDLEEIKVQEEDLRATREEAEDAVRTLDRLLRSSPTGPAGWIIPIDPMLASIREPLEKSGLFAKLAARAA